MLLAVVASGRFEVCAIAARSADLAGAEIPPVSADALDFLTNAPADMQGSARGMLKLFERYAVGGRQALTAELFHEAGDNGNIWEFVKGRLRVYCFKDDNGLVILTHGVVKKTQTTAQSDITRAVREKEAYLVAKKNGQLTRQEWTSDD